MSAEKEIAQAAAENSGLLWKIGGGVFSVGATIFGWLFGRVIQKHDQEIASIKGDIATVGKKVDTKLDTETYEVNRREQRQNVVDLHDKIDEQTTELRGSMERGFAELRGQQSDILKILVERRGSRRAND